MNKWKEEQDRCCFLLRDFKWEFAIKEGGITRRPLSNLRNILVVSEEDSFSCYMCSNFSITYLSSRLSNLIVLLNNKVKGVLGISEAIIVAEIVSSIISVYPDNRGCFWLFKSTLRALICLVLAIRNRSFVNEEGVVSQINNAEIIGLRKIFCKQDEAFIFSTQSFLFDQSYLDIEDPEVRGIKSSEEKLIRSLNLPKKIVDRFAYKYIEAKVKAYKQRKDKVEDDNN